MVAGYRRLSCAEDEIHLHLAETFRRPLPWARPVKTPLLAWQAFLPGQAVAFATGWALSPDSAASKAWKAHAAYIAGRRRWMDGDAPFSDNALRQSLRTLNEKET
jgi:hypothetical protein